MSETNYGSVGFCSLLFLLFLGLKLTGYITWSYWWIFSPLWIPVFIIFAIIGISFIILMMITLAKYFFP